MGCFSFDTFIPRVYIIYARIPEKFVKTSSPSAVLLYDIVHYFDLSLLAEVVRQFCFEFVVFPEEI